MAEDTILQPISMDTDQDTRSGSKTSGLFSTNEIVREAKDEVFNDFQRNADDCHSTDSHCNSLLYPMPYYELPQRILSNAELDIPRPNVLDETDWDLESFDVENINCDIFTELSDLAMTESADEVAGPRPELPPVAFKFSDSGVTRSIIKSPVSESSLMPTPSTVVANNFLDHNYASVVPDLLAVESVFAATCERDAGGMMEVLKTVKYVERRKKNNLASRRSRETRKRKYVEMQEQVFQLEWKNAELRKQVDKMERMSRAMKQILSGKIDVPHGSPN